MKRPASLFPRVLPVVIAAATGLLTLKALGIFAQGGYIFPSEAGRSFGRGLTEARRDPAWAGADITGASGPAKKAATQEADAVKKADVQQPLPPPIPSAAEREVLENLGARRRALDEKAKELELREQLLKSAERIAQERLEELKRTEKQQSSEAAKAPPELKALVVLYESMKPRDAAKVFEKMDITRLLPLARQIAPKKLAEIVAAMTPEVAQKLTVSMLPTPARPIAPQPGPQEPLEELERLPLPAKP